MRSLIAPSVARAVVSLGLLSGCTSIDSSDIRTSGIRAAIEVKSKGGEDAPTVVASFFVGDSLVDFVDLNDPDSVSVQAGEESKPLEERKLLGGAVEYVAELSAHEPETEVLVSLARGEDDESAPNSKVTLTQGLTLTAPAAASAFSRLEDDLVVSWNSEASEDPTSVELAGDCIQSQTAEVNSGQNTFTFAKGSILHRDAAEGDPPLPESCSATISVRRVREGSVDEAYEGGRMTHVVLASVNVTTNR